MRKFAALGALLGALPFVGAVFPVIGMPALGALPAPLCLLGVVLLSYRLAKRHEDPTGLTWYGKYGMGPGAYVLFGFMYAACIGVAGFATVVHFPVWGSHYVRPGNAVYHYATEGVCVDRHHFAPETPNLCTQALCNATLAGDVEFERGFCNEHPETCKRRTSYDWAIMSCMQTCGCEGIFNPVYQTAEGSTFKCLDTETCSQSRNFNVYWMYLRYPSLIEIHVVTGVPMMLLAPLQFLKQARHWKSFKFHRINGRCLLALILPNQASALVISLFGLVEDESTGGHLYTKVFRAGLTVMIGATFVFAGCAFFYIKAKRDVERHGEFMIRLMTFWFSIPFFRMLVPFFEAFVGARWAFALGGWAWVPTAAVAEVYIRRSERFVQPSNTPASERPVDNEPAACGQVERVPRVVGA